MESECIYESPDFDVFVVEAIRELKSGYCACGVNRIYKIMEASESYKITVPASAPVKDRVLHDTVRLILISNLLAELFNGPQMELGVYDSLEDVKTDSMLLCEEYIEFFNSQWIPHPKHEKCIELFTHIMESLASESRVDVEKAFELLE